MVEYQQRCSRCKKKFVLVSGKQRFVQCYDCQKSQLQGEIKNTKYKKMFDIPEEFYKENAFLRNIKGYYLKFGKLTENQVKAFKKVVKNLKNTN